MVPIIAISIKVFPFDRYQERADYHEFIRLFDYKLDIEGVSMDEESRKKDVTGKVLIR